jgi:hypothetical protein
MKHLDPRPITELQRWMTENRYSDPSFAEALNIILKRMNRAPVSPRSVAKWRLKEGGTIPRPETQKAIMELTEGAVTPTHFVTAVSA